MIYKLSLSTIGENMWPEKLFGKLTYDLKVKSYFNPNDKKSDNNNDVYGFGSVTFWHPDDFATDERLSEFENTFVKFILENHGLLIENGMEYINLFYEVYFDGGQCNFEVLDNELRQKIASLNIYLPISIYLLKEKEYKEWEEEIIKNEKQNNILTINKKDRLFPLSL